ncbi:MAG: hypothetical protein KKC25_12330 [Proteobacteria bacterium]|nr:hypothetical protein [Pseudomonadota bacterium]
MLLRNCAAPLDDQFFRGFVGRPLNGRLYFGLLNVKRVILIRLSLLTGIQKGRGGFGSDEPEDLRSECVNGLFQNPLTPFLGKISFERISDKDEPVVLYKTQMVFYEKRIAFRDQGHEAHDVFRNIGPCQDIGFLFRDDHFFLLFRMYLSPVFSKSPRIFGVAYTSHLRQAYSAHDEKFFIAIKRLPCYTCLHV